MIGRLPVTTVAALAIALAACLPARADDVADFYKGKQISLIIGYGPGGGYDVYGRLLAKHIGRHIPGQPTIVVLEDSLLQQAAFQMSCDPDRIKISDLGGGYTAGIEGCGKKALYKFASGAGWILNSIADAESGAIDLPITGER